MDGARLMNAVVASGTSAADYAAPFDSVWIDFSKGLGAPVGAVLAGSRDFIHEAWRVKQQIGGAMRQAGIIAAACLYALDHHVERLADDHANARHLAEGLAEIPGIELDPATVETNIVWFDVRGPMSARAVRALKEQGVLIGAYGPTRMRAVTHLDVDRDGIDVALDALRPYLIIVRANPGGPPADRPATTSKPRQEELYFSVSIGSLTSGARHPRWPGDGP